jgi:uncharacterized protein YbaP (TraB family)
MAPVLRILASLLALFAVLGPQTCVAAERHALWSVQGRTNTVYLLGSVHFLSPDEALPSVVDEAYQDAESLLMEIDMDDLDPADMRDATVELGILPPDRTLEREIGPETYAQVVARARELDIDPDLLNHCRPWLAGMTLMQRYLITLGLDPTAGVETRLTSRAERDHKPIEGLETIREQLGILAALPQLQQREFLLYSVEDTERAAREIDEMLAAWRKGDTATLARLLAEGFEEYPNLYRPLTTDRNRRWISKIEDLLDDRDDYLIVVGTLHLVGRDSLIDLLQKKGHRVTQH